MKRAIRLAAEVDEGALFQPLVHQALREYMAACDEYSASPFGYAGKYPELEFTASNGVKITVEPQDGDSEQ